MSKKNLQSSDAKVLRCPACSANIVFSVEQKQWICSSCGGKFTEEDFSNTKSQVEIPLVSDENQPELDVFRCESCGAELVTDTNTVSTFCVYCGSADIIKQRLEGRYRPNYVVPFSKTKDDAMASYREFLKQNTFVPNVFLNETNITKLTGVYVPYWLYNVRAEGTVKGNFQTSKDSTTYNLYSYKQSGRLEFEKIPADASQKLDNSLMDAIEPYDFKESKPFNYAYLSGFLAEKFDVEFQDEEQIKRITERINQSLLKKLNKSSGSFEDFKTDFTSTEYALMPIWLLNTQYEGQTYVFAMNGQTGKIRGYVPCSTAKKWIYFAAITFVIAAIIFLTAFWLYM